MSSLTSAHSPHVRIKTKMASEYVAAVKRHVKTYRWVHEIEVLHKDLDIKKVNRKRENKF
ncbi:hypothetical protein BH09BAC3_BH09BAC3_13580 [soil metagenome]